jgi:gluconate 5-dehydrogenase
MNLFDLTGKVAVITGASSGLGAAAAKAYAEYGANVALLARRKDKLDALAAEIEKTWKHKAIAVACDVSSEESVKAAIDEVITQFRKIDIVLNNAGVAVGGTVEQLTEDGWDKEMNTNVKGIYFMCKYIVPHMRKQQYGKIINTSSVNAIVADKAPELARHVYNTSKAAVRGLTIAMAASYGPDNITVNSIGPGFFKTEMTENTLFKDQAFVTMYDELTPIGRPGIQGELNGTIIYLSSAASSYVTGQHIIIDGGFSIV